MFSCKHTNYCYNTYHILSLPLLLLLFLLLLLLFLLFLFLILFLLRLIPLLLPLILVNFFTSFLSILLFHFYQFLSLPPPLPPPPPPPIIPLFPRPDSSNFLLTLLSCSSIPSSSLPYPLKIALPLLLLSDLLLLPLLLHAKSVKFAVRYKVLGLALNLSCEYFIGGT